MWGERNCLSFEMAVGGIEPPSPRLTVLHAIVRPPLPTAPHHSPPLPSLSLTYPVEEFSPTGVLQEQVLATAGLAKPVKLHDTLM